MSAPGNDCWFPKLFLRIRKGEFAPQSSEPVRAGSAPPTAVLDRAQSAEVAQTNGASLGDCLAATSPDCLS